MSVMRLCQSCACYVAACGTCHSMKALRSIGKKGLSMKVKPDHVCQFWVAEEKKEVVR